MIRSADHEERCERAEQARSDLAHEPKHLISVETVAGTGDARWLREAQEVADASAPLDVFAEADKIIEHVYPNWNHIPNHGILRQAIASALVTRPTDTRADLSGLDRAMQNGSIMCVSDGTGAGRVEIRFRDLTEAQRLHAILAALNQARGEKG